MNNAKREENNRLGKIKDLFKKIGYQGNISCKDGRNIGQKWQDPNRGRRDGKNTQNNYAKQVLMTQISTIV